MNVRPDNNVAVCDNGTLDVEAWGPASEDKYRLIFENSIVPIWIDDFSAVSRELNRLRSEGVTDLRAHLDHHPDYAFEVGSKLKVVDLNVATLKLFHADNREQLGSLINKAFRSGAIKTFEKALCAIWDKAESFTSEITFLDSEEQPINAIITFNIPAEERLFSFVPVSIINVTDLKRAEAELIEYRDQLEILVEKRTGQLKAAQSELLQQERMATLGRLTATVSHELRNPLGTIQAAICSIGVGLDTQNMQRALELAERSIARCVGIIEELNSYARVKELALSEELVDGWLKGVLGEIPKSEQVHYEHDLSSGVRAWIDKEKLRQVVVNLIDNAVHALEDKSSTGKLLRLSTGRCDGHFQVCVKDDGVGMSHEVQQRLFEPLFSTKGFGVGLGMAIVKAIVEQHKGTITIESAPGMGTLVTLRLPVNPNSVGG